jgi:hypothetical protein
MPMVDEPPGRFLVTSTQHSRWAAILRRKGKPEKALRHEQLARAIEIAVVRPRRGRHGPL